MQYISPLHFVELPPTGAIDRKDISLARKKMLAELELNGGNGIEINGKEVSKNDIVLFFDELQHSSQLTYHVAVYRDKVLLRFLEHNILERKERFASEPLYADEAFINWIAPFYTASFIHFSNDCFRFLMDKEWDTLLDNLLPVNNYHWETAWESLEKNVRTEVEQLKFIAQKKLVRDDLTQLGRLCDARRLKMLSQLPEDRFSAVRDEMAFYMMQVCIRIFNTFNQKWAVINIKNAYNLSVSEELKEQVYDRQLELELIFAKSNREFWNVDFRQWSLGRKIFVGSVVLLFCIACYYSPTNEKGQVDIYSIPRQKPPSHTIQASPGDSAALRKAQDALKQTKKDNLK